MFGGAIMAAKPRYLGNSKYELRVNVGYTPDGKQKRKVKRVTAQTSKELDKLYANFLLEVGIKKKPIDAKTITFNEFAEIWLERHNAKLSPTTSNRQKSLLESRLLPAFRNYRLSKISGCDVLDFIDTIKKPGMRLDDKKQTLSPAVIHKYFIIINHMLGKAVSWGYLERNPCDDILPEDKPKVSYQKYAIWTENELKKFLQALDVMPETPSNVKNKLMILLALITGSRKGEYSALTWDCVKFDEKSIFINKAIKYVKGKPVEIGRTKTPASVRKLFFDEYTLELFRKHHANQKSFLKKSGCRNPNNYIFTAKPRPGQKLLTPITGKALYQWLKRFCEAHELPPVALHSFRAMAASFALSCGAPLTSVQTMLAHTNIRTTSLYLNDFEEKRKETAKVLSDHLNKFREK